MGKRRAIPGRASRDRAREKLRVESAQQKRAEQVAAEQARRKLQAREQPKRRSRPEATPAPVVVRAAPQPCGTLVATLAACAAIHVASLAGSLFALAAFPGVGALLVALTLAGVPVVMLGWVGAAFGGVLRLTETERRGRWSLAYRVFGMRRDTWWSVVRPRLLLSTTRTRLVATKLGPRLLPRYVRTEQGEERELVLDDEGFTLEAAQERVRVDVAPAQEPAVRVAVEQTAHAVGPACAECGEPVEDARADCALCADTVHDGPCAARHAQRHEGASEGSVYR